MHSSANSIYFKDIEYAKYVENLWNQEKMNFSTDLPTIECIQEMTLDGYLTGRKSYALIEPEPFFVPKLYFLEAMEVQDVRYLPYRSKFVQNVGNFK